MAATATQDEDLIIFNDDIEEESLEIINEKLEKTEKENIKQTQKDSAASDHKNPENGSEEIISFDTDESSSPQGVDLDIQDDSDIIINEDTSLESDENADNAGNNQDLNEEGVNTTPEDIKAELIKAQDEKDGASFEDMGIDLDKLGDKNGENLEAISLDFSEKQEPELETNKLPQEETTSSNIEAELSSIEDFAAGIAGSTIDEGTHNGILEAAILKLVSREQSINNDIEKKDEKKSGKKDEISELKKQIKALEAEVSVIDEEIAELNNEKKTINTTKDGIEKMKIAV